MEPDQDQRQVRGCPFGLVGAGRRWGGITREKEVGAFEQRTPSFLPIPAIHLTAAPRSEVVVTTSMTIETVPGIVSGALCVLPHVAFLVYP